MKSLKRIRYNTMNSWNNAEAPAYNLKVHNVIDNDLQDKVFELMESEDFYDDINLLIRDFDAEFNHRWQAGFNGRSGGYLVLYQGGIEDGRVYTRPGLGIEDNEVPSDVKKAFRQLAIDIVKDTEYKARHFTIEEEEYQVTQTRKVMVERG